MTDRGRPGPGPRPAASGCAAGALAVALVVLSAGFLLVFLDSGSDDGRIRLKDSRAYAPGTATHVPSEGLYVVRLQAELIAIRDRAPGPPPAGGPACRVLLLEAGFPATDRLLAQYGARSSPAARGASLLFRDECSGAIYDVLGVRLDADGANLMRLPLAVDPSGRVVLDPGKPECSRRDGDSLRLAFEC